MSNQNNQSNQNEEVPVCAECGKEIELFGKYLKNNKDGTILHLECYNKLIKEGKIK